MSIFSNIVTSLTAYSLLHTLVLGATTVGPLAPISIYQLTAYSTARVCAAKCLVYQGIWHCGYNAGYFDLGSDLGCGCSPNNACWCNLKESATSYISKCVSEGCKAYNNVEGDVKSMLDLYGSYCATANVEQASSTPAIAGAATTSVAARPTGKATTGSPAFPSSTTADGQAAPDSAAADAEKKEEGLSKSDIIALATGLGVGIPSLLIGVIAVWIQLRRRRADVPVSNSQQQLVPMQPPLMTNAARPPVQAHGFGPVYELGNRGGQRPPVYY